MNGVELGGAAADFCADVKQIARQYREEGEPIQERFAERLEQIRKAERAIRAEYREEAAAHNRKYKALIERAAAVRKSEYAHPEQIDKAACIICTLMGGPRKDVIGNMGETEADNARLVIVNAESERLQAEERAKKLEAQAGEVIIR